MKKMKLCTVIGMILLLSVLTTACGSSNEELTDDITTIVEVSYDIRLMEDLDDLTSRSDDIIRGEVLDSRVRRLNWTMPIEEVELSMLESGFFDSHEEVLERIALMDFEPIYRVGTTYRIRVLEVFQGDHEVGDIIEVGRPGGRYGDEYWRVSHVRKLDVGTEYVIFLSRTWEGVPNRFACFFDGVYYVPESIEISNEDILEYSDLNYELEVVSEGGRIPLNIEDLIDIAEENGLLEREDEVDDVYGGGSGSNVTESELIADYLTFEEALAYASDVVIVQYMEASITVDGVIRFRFVVLESMLNETTDKIFVYLSDDDMSHFNFSDEGEYLLPLIRTESNDSTIEENVFIFIRNIVIDLINPSNSTMYGESIFEYSTDFNQEMTREEILSFINEHVID